MHCHHNTTLTAALLIATQTYAQHSDTLAPITVNRDTSDSYTAPATTTATGLNLSVKDTPQSVSVITRQQMDDRGLTTLEDALKTTTGLNIYRQGYQYRYQSRGFDIAQISEDGVNSTVCTMCGNNPHDQKQLNDLSLYERIEVVRGATGLKKAASEPGGSINAIRKRPTADNRRSIEGQVDRFGKVRTSGDFSGTLSEEYGLRGRVVGTLERDNTFRDHVDGDKQVLYGVLDKNLGDSTTLTLGGTYHHEHDTPSLFGLPADVKGRDLRLPRSTYLGASWNRSTYHKQDAFIELDHQFNDNWKLNSALEYKHSTSQTAYGYVPQRSNVSASGTVSDGFIGHSDRHSNQWNFRSDLDGKYTLFGREHELYAGYNYNREKFDNTWHGKKIAGEYNIFRWQGTEIAQPADWNALPEEVRHTTIHTHTLGLATRLNPIERWHLLIGASYSRWQQHQHLSWMSKPDSKYGKGRLIPYTGITYDLTPQQSLYASYSSIFKYSGDYLDINGKTLPPVMGNNYEIGWKGSWNDDRINTTLAFFQTEKHNQPIDTWKGIDPATGAVREWQRGDRSIYTPVRLQSRGIDAEIAGNLTDDWRIFAGYTYNTREYTSTAATKTITRNGKGVDFSQHTPRHILRTSTQYRLPGAASKWSIGGGFNMQSKSSPITVDGNKHYLGGYTVWHANVQYEPEKNLRIGLNINNLTDKHYYESYAHRGTSQGHFYGEPRNAMLTFRWDF
ncbi:TonB-dependent siderophore receptor [Cardiobacterium valvarum]|uniref:Ferric-pseudobactin 358 receptor n=1 Tax=Cardiobacterium valvarum TaxID=194702 RepID=A0A381E8W9_9GAMM|nr:TonB-dependent siderophore receptor [Cardiobacterium valvarum]SUX23263.1 Ferric-pseudobactin 358 receptor precursor [Cardiobacterium valvarum]